MSDEQQRWARNRLLLSAWSGMFFALVIFAIFVSQIVRGVAFEGRWWELVGGVIALVGAIVLTGTNVRALWLLYGPKRGAHQAAPDR